MPGLISILIPVIGTIGVGAMAAAILNGLKPAPVPVPIKSRQPPRR